MASGFRKSRGNDEYVFVGGRAVRADDVTGVPTAADAARNKSGNDVTGIPSPADAAHVAGMQQTAVPGQPTQTASAKPLPSEQTAQGAGNAAANTGANVRGRGRRGARDAVRTMDSEDAFAVRSDAGSVLYADEPLFADDRRIARRKYVICLIILVICAFISMCVDYTSRTFRSPVEVFQGLGTGISLLFTQIFQPASYADAHVDALLNIPYYGEVVQQAANTLKFGVCGILLAISGMLYQNAFRNPIAAPSMLGVTNGINFAVLVLVMQFGYMAYQHIDLYYLYSYIGGALVLLLVMLGGKWTSRKGGFNVVNMILIGTIVSQLLGIVITFVQNNFLTDSDWEAYNNLVQAVGVQSPWMYISLVVGALVGIIPIILFRFRMNLVSFSDEETRLLGVDPTKLRLLALGCGSLMILTAQVNIGQVAMMSLVVPFVVRAVFGAEFRKQLVGNILVGAILLIVCGMLSQFIVIAGLAAGMGAITTIIALPLFVWMIAIRQRSWD